MSAAYVTTPTKSHLPVSLYDPFNSPTHQQLSTLTATQQSSLSRRLRPSAPSLSSPALPIDSIDHYRRATAPPKTAFSPSAFPSASTHLGQEPRSLLSAPDDEDLSMADSSPMKPSKKHGSQGYRAGKTPLGPSFNNVQLPKRASKDQQPPETHAFSTSSTACDFENSPIKRPNFSTSKSLGRVQGITVLGGPSYPKRPGGLIRMNPFGERAANAIEDDDDEAVFSAGSSEGLSEMGQLKLGRENSSSQGGDKGEESDEDFTPADRLPPLSFMPSPSPFLKSSASFGHPQQAPQHHRALTEQDLNSHLPKSTSYHGPSKNLAAEDPFLSSSVERRPRSSTHTSFTIPPSPMPFRSTSAFLAPNSFISASSDFTSGDAAAGSIGSKKAVSLDNLNLVENGSTGGALPPPSPFFASTSKTIGRSRSNKTGTIHPKTHHKRTNSNDYNSNGPAQHVSRMLPSGTPKPLPSSFSQRSVSAGGVSANSTNNLLSANVSLLPQSTSLSHLPTSNSSSFLTASKVKSDSVLNRSAPASLRNDDTQPFDDAKPLLAAFQAKSSLSKKFKPRDSGIALSDTTLTDSPSALSGGLSNSSSSRISAGPMLLPPLPRRTSGGTLSRLNTSSVPSDDEAEEEEDEMSLEELVTPSCEGPRGSSGWPSLLSVGGSGTDRSGITLGGGPTITAGASAFDFLGAEAAEVMASAAALQHGIGGMKMMPDTPVKRSTSSFALGGIRASGEAKPHPLSIAANMDSSSSSPSSIPLAAQHHHSNNILAKSHRPSQGQPPHLLTHSSSKLPRPLNSKRSQTFKPSPFVAKLTARSRAFSTTPAHSPPVSTIPTLGSASKPYDSASSSPIRDGDSPTFLRRSNAMFMQTSSPGRPGLGSPGVGLSGLPTRTLMRRTSSSFMSGSESESGVDMTPTKGLGARARPLLGSKSQGSPTHVPQSRRKAIPTSTSPLPTEAILPAHLSSAHQPRLSLPTFAPSPAHSKRALHHRSSHPINMRKEQDADLFEIRFKVLEPLGQGAFSQVWKVQERGKEGNEGIWAVKRTKGVFEGVKDRLRHLEEVDILRSLSSPPSPHVIGFVDAWEQNRQLFIQTELCELGNLAFFLEEYGRVVERLDEGRAWKIVRELSDGLYHIHSQGILHLDLKPANILITTQGALKIGDFGLSTRSPRIDPAAILRGAGLGGDVPPGAAEKGWDREGDRDYMALETMNGNFGKPADIFSFGLMVLEIATNIIVPANDEPWHALRSDDFSDVDLSPLSPALIDLITLCMRANPAERPAIEDIIQHPIVGRARKGKEALVPESEGFILEILAGEIEVGPAEDMDVEMLG